jgi:hypothetical protein
MATCVVPFPHPSLHAPDGLLRGIAHEGTRDVPRRVVVEPKEVRDVEAFPNIRRDRRHKNPFGEPRLRNVDCLLK